MNSFKSKSRRIWLVPITLVAGFALLLLVDRPERVNSENATQKTVPAASTSAPPSVTETQSVETPSGSKRPVAVAVPNGAIVNMADSPEARAMALEARLRERELDLAENPDLIFELADLTRPGQKRDQVWLQNNGYPTDLNPKAWNEAEIRSDLRRSGAREALELLMIERGEAPKAARPLQLPNGQTFQPPDRLDGHVMGRSFGEIMAAAYFLGLIGPGFSDGKPQSIRDHRLGLAHHFAAQRLGDRSLLPAVIAAHPDYRFPVIDYVLAVGDSHRIVDSANQLRAWRPRGLPEKDGWRELD